VSLKDAALRYLVIVSGILTALALGQWVEARQHARQGAQALESIEAELARNERNLADVLAQQQAMMTRLQAIEQQLGGGSFAVPDLPQRAKAVVQAGSLEGQMQFSLAALQRSAWDTAVASQSLQHVPKARAVAMARAYAVIQEVSSIARQMALSDLTMANIFAMDAYYRGESPDALRFARGVHQHLQTLAIIHGSYRSLMQALRDALLQAKIDEALAASAADK
jgi:hypothetical protein